MKKLLSFVAVLAMALMVVPCTAKAATYYFDNTNTNWEHVSVHSWSADGADAMWGMDNELPEWPGIELSKDEATGYYVWTSTVEPAGQVAIMFNNGSADAGVDADQQTCDALAKAAAAGKVCVPTVQNSADDEAADPEKKANQWFGEWKDAAAAPEDDKEDAPAPTPEDDKEDAPEVTPDAGKDEAPQTGDVAPIAAVAVLAVASMAVVVATRKKMA